MEGYTSDGRSSVVFLRRLGRRVPRHGLDTWAALGCQDERAGNAEDEDSELGLYPTLTWLLKAELTKDKPASPSQHIWTV